MNKKRRRVAGFTLVELMVVLVIIGIMAGVVVASFSGQTEKAYKTRVMADFKVLEDAIEMFQLDVHRPPETLEELIVASDAEGWNGPYLKRPPLDPWNEPYIYEYTGDSSFPYELKTLGADKADGGEGQNKDYSNLDFLQETGYGQ